MSDGIQEVTCEFQTTKNCKKTYLVTKRTIRQTKSDNNGKIICLYCSRDLKHSNNKNPNSKYLTSISLFADVNKDIAYLLGFIASDGHIRKGSITISIHKKDIDILEKLKKVLNLPNPLKFNRQMVALRIQGKLNTVTCLSLLNLKKFGKKSRIIERPNIPDYLYKDFIRGYFDGDGWVNNPRYNISSPICGIASMSPDIITFFQKTIQFKHSFFKCKNGMQGIEFYGNEALNFLSWLYENESLSLNRKKWLYEDWATWVPSLSGTGTNAKGRIGKEEFKINKTQKDAILPFKTRASDSGYDIAALKILTETPDMITFDTGIKIKPPYGWFFLLCGRSSLHNFGLTLANSVGIIDRTYVGNIIIKCSKLPDYKSDNLKFPFVGFQLIPQPIVHFTIKEVFTFEETERGDGGFGSTSK